MGKVRRHAGIVSGLYGPGEIDRLRDEWSAGRTELPIAEVADWLQAQLGPQLTAYLAGVGDSRAVERWRSGRVQPCAVAELRLRAACHAAQRVVDAYDARTARTWLLGSNGRLEDEAPARMIRQAAKADDLELVVEAARVLSEGAA